jgi:hypothetical protein
MEIFKAKQAKQAKQTPLAYSKAGRISLGFPVSPSFVSTKREGCTLLLVCTEIFSSKDEMFNQDLQKIF